MSGCSTKPSIELTTPQTIDNNLLQAPVSQSLLVPCRVAYPMRELSPESDLEGLFKTFAYNLGQAEKCYNKDEDLTGEVREREDKLVKEN